jgi:hypothetical protein
LSNISFRIIYCCFLQLHQQSYCCFVEVITSPLHPFGENSADRCTLEPIKIANLTINCCKFAQLGGAAVRKVKSGLQKHVCNNFDLLRCKLNPKVIAREKRSRCKFLQTTKSLNMPNYPLFNYHLIWVKVFTNHFITYAPERFVYYIYHWR